MLVTVLDTDNAPKAGLLVRAFTGQTDLGLLEQTDANGQVTFSLPKANYWFRAELNGTPFWSGTQDHCKVPQCGAATVTVTIPVAVTVTDSEGTLLAGLPVFAFDGETYTGYSRTANGNGVAIFTLPVGNYRFRTELDGEEFWSGTENHCAIPGCLDAAIQLPFAPPQTLTTTIAYSYNALNRLTAATYNSGEFFQYAYDAVGNRLNETTQVASTDYVYDDANRLVDVGGVAFTWDNNGNLLSDGVSGYAYDAANRLSQVAQGGDTYSFVYNGMGDRVQQTMGGVVTNYTLDLHAGLTQVLADGTNAYLYGLGRIGQQSADWAYHLPDALGSVRQLADEVSGVSYTQNFEAYGELLAGFGDLGSSYGFTGEWTEATGLVYLRARYYAPGVGRFIERDPSGWEANLFSYAGSNPINRSDRTGLISGPDAFLMCFAIHSGTQVPGLLGSTGMMALNQLTAQNAVDICKLAFSKDAWASMPFGSSPTSSHNLFGMYLMETADQDSHSISPGHLVFTARDALTKELSESHSLMLLRRKYLEMGDTDGPQEVRFNLSQQLQCPFDYTYWNASSILSLPLTCFMGSFYYQLKTINTNEGTYVGFRIDNRTDLESGSHVAFRYPESGFGGSVEGLILNGQITGNESILQVLNTAYDGKYPVSILNPLDQTETGFYTSATLGTHRLGGGNFQQTFVWMEMYDPCDPISRLGFYAWRWHDREEWANWYPPFTQPISAWDAAY